jgi:4-hydroxythreonine-4-phosphate dehydrogenase
MIGITLGDPAGIGPEITLKALARIKAERLLVIGPRQTLNITADRLNLPIPHCIDLVDVPLKAKFRFGRIQRACGEVALTALETAVDLLKGGRIQGLVTAPVSKEALRLAGFTFPGQTEFLAARLGAKRHAMMAYAGARKADISNIKSSMSNIKGKRGHPSEGCPLFPLRIVFVTIHKPLAEVPRATTSRLVAEKIGLLHEFLRQQERIHRPRIAVLALNPHAYEFTLGEEARIARGIQLASRRVASVKADGPFPADTIGRLLENYDGIVAMYHDQAMIPAKLLARDRGVNVTLGLPFIRTSPLHGTAFDIAGKGAASSESMEAAIRLCLRLTKQKEHSTPRHPRSKH